MRMLVKNTTDDTDSTGRTTAYMAAQSGNSDVLKYLATFGADKMKSANDGTTPLSIAVQKGHVKVVQYFIEEREMQALANPSLLFIAARYGSTEVVQYLMKEGLLVDVENLQSMTDDAMEMAARNGHVTTVKCLSTLGATKKDVSLLIAAHEGHVEVMSYLLDQEGMDHDTCHPHKFKSATPLILAANNGHLAAVRYLVGKGADKSKGDTDGWNALHFATSEGHLDVMQYLVNEGSDTSASAKNSETALHIAAQYACSRWNGRLATASYLVQQGADMEKTKVGVSPLGVAAQYGNLEVVQYLVSTGAQFDCHYPPLYMAAQAGYLAIVQYLCAQGERIVNIGSFYDESPLYAAAKNGHVDVVLYLTENGADVNKATRVTGWTPLHIAAQKGHAEIVTCLMNWDAILTAKTNTDQLPIDIAANDAIKQLISDEEENRRNHGFKRAVIPPTSPVKEDDESGEPDSKRPRLEGEGSAEANSSRDEGSVDGYASQ